MSAQSTTPAPGKQYNPYTLDMVNGLPPGVDTHEQLYDSPRLPRPIPDSKRETPIWPPVEQRRGKWLASYLDSLDWETEYDEIIRTYIFFGGSDFSTALGYAAVFCILTQTPAGAQAVHGGKVTKRGHQRYYETQLFNLHWAYYGSNSPKTKAYVEDINRVHAGVWKRHPGTFSFPWEAQMAVIALSYFEQWVRKTVGTKIQAPHPAVQGAFPRWGEQLTSYFVTEPSDGSKTMGTNYPRTWAELEKFFYWYDDFPYDDQRTAEQKRKGHETAEAFIDQFCELWFPRVLKFVGRSVVLVFIPPGCRQRQAIGEPNFIVAALTKFFMRTYMNFTDSRGSDPVEPPMTPFREMLLNSDLTKIDANTKAQRDRQDWFLLFGLFSFIVLGCLVIPSRMHG